MKNDANRTKRFFSKVLFSEQMKLRNAISGNTAARAERAPDSPMQQRLSPSPAASAVWPILHPQDGTNSQIDVRALQYDVMFMKAKFAELQKDYTLVTQQVHFLPYDQLFENVRASSVVKTDYRVT